MANNKETVKAKVTLKNVVAYIQGYVRYVIYYSYYLNPLMRTHIKEQIDWRIATMDKECYQRGSCKLCGCRTTHLQMSDKACDKPCYPKMMSKKEWDTNKENIKQQFEMNPNLYTTMLKHKVWEK